MSLKRPGRKNRFSPRRKSAKYGNTRHGTQILRCDRRTREGRTIRAIEAALADTLGGNPLPQQFIPLQQASVKALGCHLVERAWLDGGATPNHSETSISAGRTICRLIYSCWGWSVGPNGPIHPDLSQGEGALMKSRLLTLDQVAERLQIRNPGSTSASTREPCPSGTARSGSICASWKMTWSSFARKRSA